MNSAFSIFFLGAFGVTVGAYIVDALFVAIRLLVARIFGRSPDQEECELREPGRRERASAAIQLGGAMMLGPLLVVVGMMWLGESHGAPQAGLNATAWSFALGSGIAGAALGYLDPLPITLIHLPVVGYLCGCAVACTVLLAG